MIYQLQIHNPVEKTRELVAQGNFDSMGRLQDWMDDVKTRHKLLDGQCWSLVKEGDKEFFMQKTE